MHTPKLLLFLGIWISILPYLGFPYLIKNILFVVSGFVIIYISILMRNSLKENVIKKVFENFSENLHMKK